MKKEGDSRKEVPDFSYFGVQAYWGLTKHMGGLKATRELLELCHIAEAQYVLDVGCGVGVTSCYVAKMHGCRVVGIDVSENMVNRSMERSKKDGLEQMVEFRVADAQDIPFGDSLFDAVICESVTSFVEDKQKAVKEYVRVTKPAGYVGLNEGTWMKEPPTELVDYMSRRTGAREFLTSDDWKQLLEQSGTREVSFRTYRITTLSQFREESQTLSLGDSLRAWYKFLSLYATNSSFRKYAREMVPSLKVIRSVFECLGYGMYVGRK